MKELFNRVWDKAKGVITDARFIYCICGYTAGYTLAMHVIRSSLRTTIREIHAD